MKKIIILFMCLVMTAMTVRAETIYTTSDLSYIVDTFIDKKTNKPATGVIKQGTVSIPIRNGKEHGTATATLGEDKAEAVFDNGIVVRSNMANDKLIRETTFYKGTSVPETHKVYVANGQLAESYKFTPEGFLLDFVINEVDESGNLKLFAKGYITAEDGKIEIGKTNDSLYFGKSIVIDNKNMDFDPRLPRIKEDDIDMEKTVKTNNYFDKNGKPITGIVEIAEGWVDWNDEHGFSRSTWKSGGVYTIKNGKKDGPQKSYKDNRLVREELYKNGRPLILTSYNENGNKQNEYIYGYSVNHEDHEIPYIQIKYYNGKPVTYKYAFFNGFSIGTRLDYDDNGRLRGKTIYSTPDKARGPIFEESYSENGTIFERRMEYIDVGFSKISYDKNGKPKVWNKDVLGVHFSGKENE